MLTEEERMAKAPQWVRDLISELRGTVSYLEKRNAELESQMEITRGEQEKIPTNVRLQQEDVSSALPPDSVIEFGGMFDVFPSVNDSDEIEVMLPGNGSLSIVPAESWHLRIRRMT
jgi:hypothetical protein